MQLQVPGPQHSVTAEIYQPWLEAVDSSAESLLEADVELDLHLAGGEVLDHGDHVHDQRLEIEQEAVRRKSTFNVEQFFDNIVEQDKIKQCCCAGRRQRLILWGRNVRKHCGGFWRTTR